MTNVLVLFSSAIHILCELFDGALSERRKHMTIIHNLSWNPRVPRLPTGETLAMIVPPAEQFGERIALTLAAAMEGKPLVDAEPLIPEFIPGDSLRAARSSPETCAT